MIKSIKVLSRNPDQYMRETKQDIHKVPRNYEPEEHPFKEAREYKLALNAVKLERVFAKPFIGSLTHSEGVSSMCRHPTKLSNVLTGTVEGELYLWDLPSKKCKWKTRGHEGHVWCITSSGNGESFYTVGNDKTIKQWSVENMNQGDDEQQQLPTDTWMCDSIVTGISHHRYRSEFITCGERMLLWDATTKSPKSSFDWSIDNKGNEASIVAAKFNPVETELFASSDYGNNLVLYDTRAKEVKKLKMEMRINALSWNPMEAFILTVASEDYNCYTFDIRKMNVKERIVGVHMGHTSAVVDVDYAPTGKEFCTASYDKSIRIFRVEESHSRDVYHTKRMYRVNTILWSGDNKYILSGSTDHNVRLWKATASEKLGVMRDRERAALDYSDELKRKYQHFPEIKRIHRHRHLPRHIYNAKNEHRIMMESRKRKEANRRKHSKEGAVPFVPAQQKPVIGLQDDLLNMPGSSNMDSDSEIE